MYVWTLHVCLVSEEVLKGCHSPWKWLWGATWMDQGINIGCSGRADRALSH